MSKKLPDKHFQKGQIILVVLLVMTVVLTVGLSIASRTVTDIKISQQSQESARALWVAQAGLDKAIKANAGLSSSTLNDVSYSVSQVGLGGGPEFVYPNGIKVDESMTFWLVNHTEAGEINEGDRYAGNSLTLYWGEGSDNTAIEVTCVYRNIGTGAFLNQRYAFDPITRTPPTNFSNAGGQGSIGDQSFAHTANISLPGGNVASYFLRIKPLFNTSPIVVGLRSQNVNIDFPDQGSCFESTATVLESGITRRLQECRYWQITPSIFDYVLFSGTSL